ncbi:MAG: guanylate kinase [bacterium]|nr:guanylate kinase [bacterium]
MSLLVIISSPSGGGKDTTIRKLLKIFPNSARLVTTTTRPMRPRDIQRVDYHFLSEAEFKNKISQGKMLEHVIYSGHHYGIQKEHLEKMLKSHPLVFTNIDIRGRKSIEKTGINLISIFLMPDSLDDLSKRILHRGGVTPAELRARLEKAKHEMAEANLYDYTVTNYDGKLGQTVKQVAKIIATKLNHRGTKPTIDKKPPIR